MNISVLGAGAFGTALAISLAQDGRPVTLWDLRPATWPARACQIANRDLTRDEWARYLGTLDYQETCAELK